MEEFCGTEIWGHIFGISSFVGVGQGPECML